MKIEQCISFLLLVSLFGFTHAEQLVYRSNFTTNSVRGPDPYETGNKFVTGSTPPTITALGFIDLHNTNPVSSPDGDGLLEAHRVTLWLDADGSKVTEVTVPAGPSGELVDGFRYAAIPEGSLVLEPNTAYVISADTTGLQDAWLQEEDLTPDIYFIGNNNSTAWQGRWGTPAQKPASSWHTGTFYGLVNMSSDLSPFDPTAKGIVDNGYRKYDTFGADLHAHGGGVIKTGDYYYWFGENRNYNANDTFFAVSCYRSKDLKTWEFRNHVLRRDRDVDLNFAKIERPKVIYNPLTNKFVMWMHKEWGDNYNEARTAVASCDTVDGDYIYHGSFRPLGHMSRDCTLYVDDDGSAYFLSAANNNSDLNLYKLTSDFLSPDELITTIWPGQWRESPCLFKRNGVYFIVSSGTTGWNPNQAKYGSATDLSGPWSELSNLGSSSTSFDTQPHFVLTIQSSEETSYLYMGDRWARAWGDYTDRSRYVWMPLVFPTDTTLSMQYVSALSINVETGSVIPVYPIDTHVSSTSPANFVLDTAYRIMNRKSGKILTLGGSNKTIDGGPLQQFTNAGADYQKWLFEWQSDDTLLIRNLFSGKVADVDGSSLLNAAPIVQNTDSAIDSQKWQVMDTGTGVYKIENLNSKKRMDIQDGSWDDSAGDIQYEGNGGDNQQWLILPSQDGDRNIWIEAESASNQSDFSPFTVGSGGALPEGEFIVVPTGTGDQSGTPNSGICNYQFTTDIDARVRVRLLAHCPSMDHNAFAIRLDGQQYENLVLQEHPTDFLGGYWSQRALDSGVHTLSIAWREDGTLLDKILIQIEPILRTDYDNSGIVDMSDLIILSTNWLQVASTYDIAPVGGDGIVDLLEFQVLSEEWFR